MRLLPAGSRFGWVFGIVCAFFAATVLVTGCQSSSHKSVRSYDYNEEPPDSRRAAQMEPEREEEEGDWKMVSPGEMVVDPKKK